MGLPKNIIKKYGVTKKAWRIFKESRQALKIARRGVIMPKKRRARIRTRRAFKRGFRRAKKGMGDLGIILSGMLYGAGREKLSNVLAPITSKIPLGFTADNIVLGGLGYFVWKGKIPLLKGKLARDVGKAAVIIESALVGQDIIKGTIKTGTTTAVPSNRGGSFR